MAPENGPPWNLGDSSWKPMHFLGAKILVLGSVSLLSVSSRQHKTTPKGLPTIPDAAGGSNVILAGEALNGPPTFTLAA